MLRKSLFMISAVVASGASAQNDWSLTDVLDKTRDMVLEIRSHSGMAELPTDVKRKCFVLANDLYGFATEDNPRVDLAAGYFERLCDDPRQGELEFLGMIFLLEGVEPQSVRYTNIPGDAVINFQTPRLTEKTLDPVQISQCWNSGSLSAEARNTTVIASFYIDTSGRVDPATISMDDAAGFGTASERQAFEAARRAILRCGAGGLGGIVDQKVTLKFSPNGVDLSD